MVGQEEGRVYLGETKAKETNKKETRSPVPPSAARPPAILSILSGLRGCGHPPRALSVLRLTLTEAKTHGARCGVQG